MVMPYYPGLKCINDQFKLGALCNPLEPDSIAKALDYVLIKDRRYYRDNGKKFLDNSIKPTDAYRELHNYLENKYSNDHINNTKKI